MLAQQAQGEAAKGGQAGWHKSPHSTAVHFQTSGEMTSPWHFAGGADVQAVKGTLRGL